MQAVAAKKTPTPSAKREMVSLHFREEYHGAFIGSLSFDEVGVASFKVGGVWSACWQSVS